LLLESPKRRAKDMDNIPNRHMAASNHAAKVSNLPQGFVRQNA
jgi:hypothetical protein